MHNVVKNLLDIENNIKLHLNKINLSHNTKVIAVSKTFKIEKILPLIEHDYIHSVDNKKLAKKIADEQFKINKKIKIFLQVNIGDEEQKSGINKNEINELLNYCNEIGLNIIGLMCIPPFNINPKGYFEEMNKINKALGFSELSMGMSSDYLIASKNLATFIRVGSSIFGQRS